VEFVVRMRIIIQSIFLGAALAVALSACADEPSPQETARKRCVALRDHLIDLRLADAAQAIDVTAHREAMKQALGEGFIETCVQQVSAGELNCELSATNLSAASACRSQ
jgi:hypothetical protein